VAPCLLDTRTVREKGDGGAKAKKSLAMSTTMFDPRSNRIDGNDHIKVMLKRLPCSGVDAVLGERACNNNGVDSPGAQKLEQPRVVIEIVKVPTLEGAACLLLVRGTKSWVGQHWCALFIPHAMEAVLVEASHSGSLRPDVPDLPDDWPAA